MPAAVPDFCGCVIRVGTCLDYGSIICYFVPSWLPLIFSGSFRIPRVSLRLRAYSFHPQVILVVHRKRVEIIASLSCVFQHFGAWHSSATSQAAVAKLLSS